MAVSSHAVANKFLELAQKDGKSLTNMQLQKLVFIAHGYTLALLERPLYYNDTYAWQWGPVIPKLYKSLQKYGRNVVREKLDSEDTFPEDSEEKDIVEAVWEGYGRLSGGQLSALTHKEDTPWSVTWESTPFKVIPQSLISEHYKNLIAAP